MHGALIDLSRSGRKIKSVDVVNFVLTWRHYRLPQKRTDKKRNVFNYGERSDEMINGLAPVQGVATGF